MKILELIAALEKLELKYGDIDVKYNDTDTRGYIFVDYVEINTGGEIFVELS